MTNKKNVFVTGGSGFVGKNLVEHLNAQYPLQYNVFYPHHKKLELLDDEKVAKFIDRNNIDVIIHCASVGGSRKTAYDTEKTDVVSKNLRMFFNIARCLTPEMRMIHMGSGAEYDRRHYTPKMSEDYFDKHVPEDGYGFSKYVISKYVEKTDNITCLRIFGLYGKYEDYHYKFISNAIIKNLLQLPITINQNVVFDYLYIDDFILIVDRILREKPKYSHLNATPKESINLISIAKVINETGHFKSEICVLNEGMNTEYSGDNSRLLKEMRGLKFTPYKEGIKQLYDYYASIMETINAKAIKEDPYLGYCKTK
jgi:nucleoside-diphosphate-sugar epimerase